MSAKDDYFGRMVSQFKRWDAEVGTLTERCDASMLSQHGAQLKKMRANRDTAHRQLLELRTASESAWRSMQSGLDSALRSMKIDLVQLSSKFKRSA
jgi:hypothetical protein